MGRRRSNLSFSVVVKGAIVEDRRTDGPDEDTPLNHWGAILNWLRIVAAAAPIFTMVVFLFLRLLWPETKAVSVCIGKVKEFEL